MSVHMQGSGIPLIDMAAANGGNCVLTKPEETVTHQGVPASATLTNVTAADNERAALSLWGAHAATSGLRSNCNAIDVNGEAAKPAKPLRGGERLEITIPNGRRILKVVALSERRGPASETRSGR